MPISRFPNHGHPLAPTLLVEFLNVTLPGHDFELSQLDATAWQKFDEPTCRQLAKTIVDHLTPQTNLIILKIGHKKLAPTLSTLTLDQLVVDVRTFNCLQSYQQQRPFSGLQDLSISEVLQIRSFGIRSLVDLLGSIESQLSREELGEVEAQVAPPVRWSPPSDDPRDPAEILRELVQNDPGLKGPARHATLPPLASGIVIEDLDLKPRTHAVLVRAGLDQDLSRLASMTLKEFSELKGCGITSVVDLLEKIGRIRAIPASAELTRSELDAQATQLLEAVFSIDGAAKIHQSDPRFCDLLPKIATGVERVGDLQVAQVARTSALKQLGELRKLIAESHQQSLASEVTDILASRGISPHNRDIIASYYCQRQFSQATLETVAEHYGISRERVRVLCTPSRIKKLVHAPFAPIIDRTLSVIDRSIPNFLAEVESALVEAGLIAEDTSLYGVLRVAKALHRGTNWTIIGHGAKDIVIPKSLGPTFRKVRRTVNSQVRRQGAAFISQIVEHLSAELPNVDVDGLVVLVAHTKRGFTWLDPERRLFWFGPRRMNPTIARIRKIMHVCRTISVSDLRTAMRRDHRMRGRVPETEVLLAMCRHIPGLSVSGDQVERVTEIDAREVLRGDEARLVKLLAEMGSLCRRKELQAAALASGISIPSFWRCVEFSSVVVRYAPSVFGLLGIQPDASRLEAVAEKRVATKVAQDHGMTDNGGIWIAFRLSESSIMSGALGVPAATRDELLGRFQIITAGGKEAGTFNVTESNCWGLGPFFRRAGAEQNDYLLAIFQPVDRTMTVKLGDESLLEQFDD